MRRAIVDREHEGLLAALVSLDELERVIGDDVDRESLQGLNLPVYLESRIDRRGRGSGSAAPAAPRRGSGPL